MVELWVGHVVTVGVVVVAVWSELVLELVWGLLIVLIDTVVLLTDVLVVVVMVSPVAVVVIEIQDLMADMSISVVNWLIP